MIGFRFVYLKLVSLGLYVTTIARTDMCFRQCKLVSTDTIIFKVSMMISGVVFRFVNG